MAVDGKGSTFIITVSRDTGQVPLLILHLNLFGPTLKPVTVDAGLFGEVIVPEPDINDHVPIPTSGAFPAKVAEEEQIV